MKNRKNFFELLFLGIFSGFYGTIVSIRNFLYDYNFYKSKEFDIPIISIGNISVGGTGKTPHSEFLINLLKDKFKIAVLSRGYKRKSKGFRLVEILDSYYDTGDEPLQIKQKFPEVIVAVCKKREIGIKKLKDLYPELSLIILDDAFQYRKVNPGISIVLNDFNNPIAKDHLLPLGRLRESKASIHRADIVIYTKCPPELKPIDIRILANDVDIKPYQYLFFSTLKYQNLKPVFEKKRDINLSDLYNYNVLLVTGIAKSKNLVEFIGNKCKSLSHLNFPDHHNFCKKDINNIIKSFLKLQEPRIIAVTEKDAVRLSTSKLIIDDIKQYIYSIPIKVELLCKDDDKKQLEDLIINYIRNNQTYSKIYKNKFSNYKL